MALVGLFGATSIGYASYVVSRDSVGLPVTKLKLSPNTLAPVSAKQTTSTRKSTTATTATKPRTTQPPTVYYTDDHGGRSPNSGKGSDDKDD